MSFPNDQVEVCLIETNKQLQENQKRETNITEHYKLFGIIILKKPDLKQHPEPGCGQQFHRIRIFQL